MLTRLGFKVNIIIKLILTRRPYQPQLGQLQRQLMLVLGLFVYHHCLLESRPMLICHCRLRHQLLVVELDQVAVPQQFGGVLVRHCHT
jgi:hypothetical protein